MKEIKRVVGLLLCFVMVFGLLPVHALALDFDDDVQAEELIGEFIPGDVHQEILTPDATEAKNVGSGNLPGDTNYVLDTNAPVDGGTYLIVSGNNGTVSAFRNNYGSRAGQSVTVSSNAIAGGFDYESACTWTFTASGQSWYIANDDQKIRLDNEDILNGSGNALTVSHQGNGAYRIQGNRYLRYYNSNWERTRTASNVYLFKQKTAEGTSVDFTVTPASKALKPGDILDLNTLNTLIKLGDGTEVKSSVITWEIGNDDDDVASFDRTTGQVTAKADGTATITATLSKVNDTSLVEPIVVEVTITVATKTVTSGKLMGDNHVTTKQNVEPVFSGIKLHVTYDDGSSAEITTANGLRISGYDITKIGSSYATVSYNGVEYGTVRVTVEGNPYEGLEEATVYPEYPADGAVRIGKTAKELEFASTGLVQVELDVAGISVRNGIDAVLTIDVSNSMAWKAGTKTDNWDHNKLTDVMIAVKNFASILLAPSEDGTPNTNTITIVTFAGFDEENTPNKGAYVDSVRTLVTATSSMAVINEIASKTKFTGKDGDYKIQLAYIPANKDQNNVDNVTTVSGKNRGDTNYDYAFWQTEQAVDQIITANGADSTRETHVLFMTDGCASNFNGYYYRSSNAGYYYKPGTKQAYSYDTKNPISTGRDWAGYILETLIPQSGGNIYAKSLYEKITDMYAVGFDMAHGSFSGISNWDSSVHWDMVFNEVVQNVVQDDDDKGMINVTNATDTEILSKFYRDLATKLRYAGTAANVADEIDPDFTLQMSSFTGTVGQGIGQVNIAEKGYTPSITIKTYDLYSKTETNDPALIGTRKGTSQDIETVTFNADGTAATSDKKDGNILRTEADGTVVIEALYFTYTKTPEGVETFKWNIGNITDKEIALSYFAYLKGSLEGKEPDGLKYTNEGATLDYVDINGKHAQQIFPIPAVAWGGASTSYEFYLVNDDGKPCDRNGNEIPFANRIIITGPYFQELYLNQSDEEIAQEIIAVKVLPAGYTLYDDTAKYTVQTASGKNQGSLVISDPAAGKVQTTKLVSAVTPSYIQSRVAFGVKYNQIPTGSEFAIAPDAVVIDYGKEIIIDVNSNNKEIPSDVTATLIGFSKFYDNVDVKQQFSNTPYSTPFEGTYGTFSITADNKVSYVPHKLVNNVGKIFCVYRLTKGTDAYYMVSELDVIPATVMYYETDFATGVFTTNTDWETKSEGAAADGPQNDGTIGQNTYGFDSTYDNDAYLSNGSSLFVNGLGYTASTDAEGKPVYTSNTYTTFSFNGTGFDLISRTGEKQGLIKVQVFANAKMTTVEKTVSVLNKSESTLELYQIPVVSINGLEHGTHYVRIEVDAAYENEKLPALNRGDEFYFDAIRIYDPVKGNAMAEAAYNTDGEANNKLDEVRTMLLSAETYATITDVTTGMVFIDRTKNDVAVADYVAIGPNNEVYLSQNQAVAFKVNASSIPASFDIGAKSITGSTAGLKVAVYDSQKNLRWTVTKNEIKSSTVQFIDLLAADGSDASQLYKGAYVVITNTGSGVLSITDLKTAFSVSAASVADMDEIRGGNELSVMSLSAAADPFAVSYTVDASTLDVARMVLCGAEEPEIPEVPETPVQPGVDTSDYAILDATLKVIGSKKNQKCTFTVVTKQTVESIEIAQNAEELIPTSITFKDKKNGIRTWTIVLTSGDYDSHSFFVVTGVGEDGVRGQSVSVHNIKSR